MKIALLLACLALTALGCQSSGAHAHASAQQAGPAHTTSAQKAMGGLSEQEFKALHELSTEQTPPHKGTLVRFGSERAYLSLPAGGRPGMPAVVVIHEWWGLNDHIMHWADRLAGEGYAALAVDLYHGRVATNADEALPLYKEATGDRAGMLKTLTAAVRFLREDERVKAAKVGSVGWCMGGLASQMLAIAAPDLDACAIYYGGGITTDAAEVAKIKAPVLGIFGSQDKSIPLETVNAFRAALDKAGTENKFLIYDAVHAFANPSNPKYDLQSASRAWGELKLFFGQYLRGSIPATPLIPATPKSGSK